jgi:hypothetical protein
MGSSQRKIIIVVAWLEDSRTDADRIFPAHPDDAYPAFARRRRDRADRILFLHGRILPQSTKSKNIFLEHRIKSTPGVIKFLFM